MPSPSDPNKPEKRNELFPGLGQVYRDFGPYLALGFQLAAAVLAFFLVGWWLDTRYETSPVFKLIGLLLGSIGGMMKFFKSVSNLNKSQQDRSPESKA